MTPIQDKITLSDPPGFEIENQGLGLRVYKGLGLRATWASDQWIGRIAHWQLLPLKCSVPCPDLRSGAGQCHRLLDSSSGRSRLGRAGRRPATAQ